MNYQRPLNDMPENVYEITCSNCDRTMVEIFRKKLNAYFVVKEDDLQYAYCQDCVPAHANPDMAGKYM